MPSPLRVAVSMSGGSSLGAYHAGAMAALLVAVGHLHGEEDLDVEIDVVGGASAGALVATLSAYSLMEGVDPVRLLHQAWVDGVSLDLLRGREGPRRSSTRCCESACPRCWILAPTAPSPTGNRIASQAASSCTSR